jgi:hypothetical protein
MDGSSNGNPHSLTLAVIDAMIFSMQGCRRYLEDPNRRSPTLFLFSPFTNVSVMRTVCTFAFVVRHRPCVFLETASAR